MDPRTRFILVFVSLSVMLLVLQALRCWKLRAEDALLGFGVGRHRLSARSGGRITTWPCAQTVMTGGLHTLTLPSLSVRWGGRGWNGVAE